MHDMMKALKGKMMPVEEKDKSAKMEVLKELIRSMNELIASDNDLPQQDMMDNEQQVMVKAENPQDLKAGLGMAKEMIADDMNPDMDVDVLDYDEEDTEF